MIKKMVSCASFLLMLLLLPGCMMEEQEQAPVAENLPVLSPLNGNTITLSHELGEHVITTSYDLGDYKLENWRITDSKSLSFRVLPTKIEPGTEILVEHVHADITLKSTSAQLDGLTQDSMDNSYHGTSQDGFWISEAYPYHNIFAIEGFSKDLISGWEFYAGGYGSGGLSSDRLTENNLLENGTYGSKLTVVYNLLIKNAGESKYHIESFEDEILIPTKASLDAKVQKEKEEQEAAQTPKE